MIIVFFGQPGSGKTTLAKHFPTYKNIDGDELRELFNDKDYSREGRIRNLNRASDIAHYLHRHGNNVTLSLVYPYQEARDYLNKIAEDVIWVFLNYYDKRGKDQFIVKDFEPVEHPNLWLNTTNLSEDECINKIKFYIDEYNSTRK